MSNGTKALIDPQVSLNNEVIQVVPNTSTLRLGKGETSVDVTSAGNGNTDIVVGDDVTTKKGYFATSVRNTEANATLINSLKDDAGGITLSISEGSFNKIMRKASIINDPEFAFTNDSSVEVQLEGLPFK